MDEDATEIGPWQVELPRKKMHLKLSSDAFAYPVCEHAAVTHVLFHVFQVHLGRVLHEETDFPSESGAAAAGADQQDVRDAVPRRVARRHQVAQLPHHEVQEDVPPQAARGVLIVSSPQGWVGLHTLCDLRASGVKCASFSRKKCVKRSPVDSFLTTFWFRPLFPSAVACSVLKIGVEVLDATLL